MSPVRKRSQSEICMQMLITKIPDPQSSACIYITTDARDEQPAIVLNNHNSSSLLQDLLYPLDEKIFLNDCFGECAVHIAGQNRNAKRPNRLSHISEKYLFGLDPRSILKETSSESVFVWLHKSTDESSSITSKRQVPSRMSSSSLIHSIEVNQDDAFYLHQMGGHSTYCRAPAELEQLLVSNLLSDTGLGCGQYDPTGQRTNAMGRGEVEVFLSRTADQVTGWHYDFQQNFTLQLSGVKKWTVQKGTVRYPLQRACTPHYNSPDVVESQLLAARLVDPKFEFDTPVQGRNAVGEVQVITLQPGDVFYFPAGMWHTIEVIEPGVSINISLMATNYASLTSQTLQHILVQQEEWRKPVQHTFKNAVVEQLKSLLQTLPDIIQKFEANNGAEAMIPPLFYQQINVDSQEGNSHDRIDDDDDDDDDDDNEIIRISDFQGKASHAHFSSRWELIQNSLASLLSANSIQRFYKTKLNDGNANTEERENEKPETEFVLNVNYAGNEAQESAIRVRLSAHPKEVEALELALNLHKGRLPASVTQLMYRQHVKLIDCLVFYGYLLWHEI